MYLRFLTTLNRNLRKIPAVLNLKNIQDADAKTVDKFTNPKEKTNISEAGISSSKFPKKNILNPTNIAIQ